MLVHMTVTIEPEHPPRPQSAHDPRAKYRSRLVEGYREQRSDPQRETTSPEGT